MCSQSTISSTHVQPFVLVSSRCTRSPTAHVQSVDHLSCQYLVSTPTHLPITNIQSVHYLSTPVQSVHNLYFLCPVSASYCLPIPSHQCTISPDHVESLPHLTCSCLVNTPSLLLMFSQHTTLPTSVQSVHCLFCQFPVSTPILIPVPSQNKKLSVCLQSVHYLFCLLSAGGMVY